MKKLLTSLMAIVFSLLILPPTTFAAEDEQAVVSSFEEVIQKYIQSYQDAPRIMVYNIPDPSKSLWIKSKCVLKDYTYDIKKTESTITPYTATFIYNDQVWLTNFQPSKDAAESCEIFKNNPSNYKNRIIYYYQHDQWIVKKEEYYSPIDDKWINITDDYANVPYNRMSVK